MTSRTRPTFPRGDSSGFYPVLKERARAVLSENERRAGLMTWLQVILFPSALVAVYSLLLLQGDSAIWFYGSYAAFGAVMTVMVLNLVHDAVHRSLFSSPRANRLAAWTMDFVGANSFVWGRRHVQLHHTYTNVPGWDVDIEDRSVIRLSPTDEHRPAHRYQHLYLPLLYPVYTLNWLLIRDFRDLFSRTSLVGRTIRIPRIEYLKLFLAKLFFLTYIVGIPALALDRRWFEFLVGFLLLQGVSSLITLLIVLPTHFDEHASFPVPNADMQMEEEWALHQIRTTNDYATDRPLVTFVLGGLNHHVAHHLFPAVNHHHLPHLTRLVESVAAEYGIPYKSSTFMEAVRSHFRLLKKNGLDPSAIFNE